MDETVLLGHGSGGLMMKRIIDEVFFAAYGERELLQGDDAAVLKSFGEQGRIAFSTDSYVVTPHFFPGADIGRLAVCGTVNDVATSGATPLYLSCSFILEEGFQNPVSIPGYLDVVMMEKVLKYLGENIYKTVQFPEYEKGFVPTWNNSSVETPAAGH